MVHSNVFRRYTGVQGECTATYRYVPSTAGVYGECLRLAVPTSSLIHRIQLQSLVPVEGAVGPGAKVVARHYPVATR